MTKEHSYRVNGESFFEKSDLEAIVIYLESIPVSYEDQKLDILELINKCRLEMRYIEYTKQRPA